MILGKFTVYFEDQFWVGVAEISDGKKSRYAKIVFGNEPSGAEIYEFTKNNYSGLSFKELDNEDELLLKKINPKRMIKLSKKEQEENGISTKSQLAIKKVQESKKNETKEKSKLEKEQEKEIKFLIRQDKKKQKKKGH